ncbi:hypothetical protein [Asticcacaulis sp. EMRT-3]|uniref:hypothetical protein n=1 Tax=Asticcacaulis sp. EMRT-3 TaxID=3040349 RepID=UPI0024AFEF98|nr:hypothetical protein [Asticcacaulis sp. EMRT-3]MDI7775425.1 hypothetical protein [Asticcacaulis sp. EMRT-3]
MKSQIGKLKYVFIILLGLTSAAITAWTLLYQIPQKKCDAAGGWFSYRYRNCETPIYLPTLTGRKPGAPETSVTIDFHDGDKKASNAQTVNRAAKTAAPAHQAAQ